MHPRVGVKFGMESGYQLVALTGCNNATIDFGKHADSSVLEGRIGVGLQHLFNIGRTDERHGNDGGGFFVLQVGRTRVEACALGIEIKRGFCMETAELSAVGVTNSLDMHRGKGRLRSRSYTFCQQDESCTCAEDGQTACDGLSDGGEESQLVQQLGHGGALATWNNQSVLGLVPVCQLSHLKRLYTQPMEHLLMLYEGSLQSKYRYSYLALFHLLSLSKKSNLYY